jgi:hypothetical protein
MNPDRNRSLTLEPFLLMVFLTGCAGLDTIGQPTLGFYDAAVALNNAEQRILLDLNRSITRSYQDRAEVDYLSGKNFDVSTNSSVISQESIDVRIKATQAVQLYAQKLLDLTSSQQNQTLDTNMESAAQSLETLLPNSVPPEEMGHVSAALDGIANIVLDQERYKTIVEAARAAQPHLETLARLIRNDDAFIETPLKAAAAVDRVARNQILEHIRNDRLVTQDRLHASFRDVLSYEGVTDLSPEQAAIDDLANAIVRTNALLAKGNRVPSMAVLQNAMNRINNLYQVSQATKKTQ